MQAAKSRTKMGESAVARLRGTTAKAGMSFISSKSALWLRTRIVTSHYSRVHRRLARSKTEASPRGTAILPAVVALALWGLLTPARAQDSESLFSEARAYQEKEEWSLAEDAYRQFLRQVPASAAGHSNLGIVYVHEDKFEEAIREYQTALRINPSLSGVYLNLGIAYFQEGKYSAATPALEKFLSADPQNHQAEELLGLCDLELDKYQDAIRMLSPLRAEGKLDILMALSAAYVRLRRMPDAQGILRQVLDSPQSNSAQVHFLMGQTYAGLSQFPQALQEFKAVLAADRDWPQIHLLLGATEAKVGQYQDAEADLHKQLQSNANDTETLFTLGALLNKRERFQEALPFLMKVRDLDPKSADVEYELALARWKTGSQEDAWAAVVRAVRLDPQNRQAHYLYAQIARQRSDNATAQREFAIAESLSTGKADQDILRLSEESQNRREDQRPDGRGPLD
jgi:tetratricopeptide (TPR) repeat protein